MGLNYAYELVARRSSAERLVRALAEHLMPEQGARLLATLAHGVEGVMDRFERAEHGNYGFDARVPPDAMPRDACLTFLFPEDAHVTAYRDEQPEGRLRAVEGRFPVGCVWTDVTCGVDFVRVSATAAASSMSVLFSESRSVRSVFAAIGETGGAFLVAFDEEMGYLDAVWPHEGRLSLPSEFLGSSDDFSVDVYGAYLLDALGRTFGGPAPGPERNGGAP